MMTEQSTKARRAETPPDVSELKSAWNRCVQDRYGNYWERQRLNWETRFCYWSGQTRDGRKWPAVSSKARVWPWPGASDSRVHLVDKYIREDVALLMQIWQNQRVLVRPNVPAKDAGWSNRMTGMLRWLIYEEMEESEGEAELLANLVLERGAAALGIWWDKTETLTRDKIEMQAIMQGAQQAQQRLAQGQRGESLELAAQLPQLLMDPTLEAAAIQLLGGISPEAAQLTPKRLGQVIRDLRETGVAEFPRSIVSRNRPCIRTLAWNEDLWLPPECVDLQRSRQCFTRELLTENDILDRAKQYGWDANYTDELIETKRGAVTELGERFNRRGRGTWNSLVEPQHGELYELVTAYERLPDADGISGIYATAFCPQMNSEKHDYASSELLDYAHQQFPFVVFANERRSRVTDDARGYGEVASTWQTQIKKQWDARIDRTDVATLPPSHHPPGEEPDSWGPGVSIPTMQPERFGYFEIPKYDAGSKEIEETVRRFADEYFGRPVDEQNGVQAATLQQELTRKWLGGWKRACTQILQLCQQYMPDEFFFRVVGGEQGQGIRATREEIQGPFNVSLKFNVRDVDPELVAEKLGLMERALAMDVNAIVDRNETIKAAFELVDPAYGERLLRPAESAALAEVEDEKDTLAKMLLGIQVDVKGNEAFMLRKQTLTQLIQNNSTAQKIIQGNPNVQENVKRRVEQLDFNIQQRMVNPQIGRTLGTQPQNQTGPMAGQTGS
jgi:hypothetical protein